MSPVPDGFNNAFFWNDDLNQATVVAPNESNLPAAVRTNWTGVGVPGLTVSGAQLGPLRLGSTFITSRRASNAVMRTFANNSLDVWWSILAFPMVNRDNSGGFFFDLTPAATPTKVFVGVTVTNGTWRLAHVEGANAATSGPLNAVRIFAPGDPFLIVSRCRWNLFGSDVCHAELFGRQSNRVESQVLGGRNLSFFADEISFTRLSVTINNWQLSEIRIGSSFQEVAFDPPTAAPAAVTTRVTSPLSTTITTARVVPSTTTTTTTTTTATTKMTAKSTAPPTTATTARVVLPTSSTLTGFRSISSVVGTTSSSSAGGQPTTSTSAPITTTGTVGATTSTTQTQSLDIVAEPPSHAMGIGIGVGVGALVLIAAIAACACFARRRGRKDESVSNSNEPIVAPPKPAREDPPMLWPAVESERASSYGPVPSQSEMAGQEYEMLSVSVAEPMDTMIYQGAPPRPQSQYVAAPLRQQV